jgi:hypothetical protein
MLKIRDEQMQAFEQAALNERENRLLEYLKEFFPTHYQILGEDQARKLIDLGVDQAKTYAITVDRELCLYINLMLMIGSGFDTDPQLPWAAEILGNSASTNISGKVKRLYNRAMGFLDQVAGLDNEHSERVLQKLRETPIDVLLPPVTEDFTEHTLTHIRKLYPEKYALVEETGMRGLIQTGLRRAAGYGITSPRGTGIMIGMMFLLGHRFDIDPQFHWAKAALQDESIADPNERVARLYENGKAFLEKWLSK